MSATYGHLLITVVIITTFPTTAITPTTIRNFLISLCFIYWLNPSFCGFIKTFAQLGCKYFFVSDGNNGLGSAFCYSSANLE